MSVIIENQLFPCIDYIKKVSSCKNIKIELYDYFKKMSFRNRFVISGANGLNSLTIPIAGGREQKTLMQKIIIDKSEDWQKHHWRSLVSAYGSSPFFEHYQSSIQSLIFSKQPALFAYNLNVIQWVLQTLNINVEIGFTDCFISEYEQAEDFRNCLLPKNFQENRKDWEPKYAQVFEDRLGFQPNLSIIDLLFCEGPNAKVLLERSILKE